MRSYLTRESIDKACSYRSYPNCIKLCFGITVYGSDVGDPNQGEFSQNGSNNGWKILQS